jgi:hypothetical protein
MSAENERPSPGPGPQRIEIPNTRPVALRRSSRSADFVRILDGFAGLGGGLDPSRRVGRGSLGVPFARRGGCGRFF